jgi:hypothetical protein
VTENTCPSGTREAERACSDCMFSKFSLHFKLIPSPVLLPELPDRDTRLMDTVLPGKSSKIYPNKPSACIMSVFLALQKHSLSSHSSPRHRCTFLPRPSDVTSVSSAARKKLSSHCLAVTDRKSHFNKNVQQRDRHEHAFRSRTEKLSTMLSSMTKEYRSG